MTDPREELVLMTAFFQSWRDQADLIDLFTSIDIEIVIIERLKVFFTRFFHEKVSQEMPNLNLALANFVISFNSYSLLGLLLPWFESGMKQPPEDLAGFYIQLAGSALRRKAVENYQTIIR